MAYYQSQRRDPFPVPLFTSERSELRVIVKFDSAKSQESIFVLKRFKENTPEAYKEIALHRYAYSQCPLGVVRFVSEYNENGSLGFLMEPCKWEDLSVTYSQITNPDRWTEPDLLRFALAMFRTVSALHSLGLVHHNLEPENWLLTTDNHLKLTDFGKAELVPLDSIPTGPNMNRYNAPESKFVDDLQGLGKALYQIALLKKYRFIDTTGKDLIESRIRSTCQELSYSPFIANTMIYLLFTVRDLNSTIADVEKKLGIRA